MTPALGRVARFVRQRPKLRGKTVKLYMHPVATVRRPVRLSIAENKIPVDEEVVDIMTGAQ
jgi:hypothetical protein